MDKYSRPFGSFILMLALSVPISFAIAISTLITIMISLPLDSALTVVTKNGIWFG